MRPCDCSTSINNSPTTAFLCVATLNDHDSFVGGHCLQLAIINNSPTSAFLCVATLNDHDSFVGSHFLQLAIINNSPTSVFLCVATLNDHDSHWQTLSSADQFSVVSRLYLPWSVTFFTFFQSWVQLCRLEAEFSTSVF